MDWPGLVEKLLMEHNLLFSYLNSSVNISTFPSHTHTHTHTHTRALQRQIATKLSQACPLVDTSSSAPTSLADTWIPAWGREERPEKVGVCVCVCARVLVHKPVYMSLGLGTRKGP